MEDYVVAIMIDIEQFCVLKFIFIHLVNTFEYSLYDRCKRCKNR